MPQRKSLILLALGANLPLDAGGVLRAPQETLRAALSDLAAEGVQLDAVSAFYQTPCFPAGAGPDYINAAARGFAPSGWDAMRILQLLHAIEERYARKRDTRWAGRTLDLDLIAFGTEIAPDEQTQSHWRTLPLVEQMRKAPDRLLLPHPRLQDRAFVLRPLLDVAPDWRHPILGLDVAEMLAARPEAERAEIRPLEAL